MLLLVLDNSVVGNNGPLTVCRDRAAEEERAHEEHVPLDAGIPLDDSCVDERHEEESGQKTDTSAGAHGDSCNVPTGLLVEAEVGRSLVDDGERADSAGNEEEERRSPDSPGNRVLAKVDDKLDQHEDGRTEAGGNGRGHTEASEDGTKTLAVVPAPLDLIGTSDCDTDTSNSGDQRVGRGNVSRVASAPHDPGGSGSKRASEGKHLNTGIAVEGVVRNDAVLDRVGSSCADCDGTEEFEDGAEDHGLSVGDGPRGDRGGPGVGYIVGAVVVGIQHGKEGADGEDIGVLVELRHVGDDRWSLLVDEGVFW